jgi:hypothetical protein
MMGKVRETAYRLTKIVLRHYCSSRKDTDALHDTEIKPWVRGRADEESAYNDSHQYKTIWCHIPEAHTLNNFISKCDQTCLCEL